MLLWITTTLEFQFRVFQRRSLHFHPYITLWEDLFSMMFLFYLPLKTDLLMRSMEILCTMPCSIHSPLPLSGPSLRLVCLPCLSSVYTRFLTFNIIPGPGKYTERREHPYVLFFHLPHLLWCWIRVQSKSTHRSSVILRYITDAKFQAW